MSEYSWVATEVLTGEIIADLRDLQVERVKLSLGRYESATAELPLPTAPEDWERATLHGATNLILLRDNPDDPTRGIPVWGGMVSKRNRNSGDLIPMTLATLEAYFDRRYVGDEEFVQVGQNIIVKTMVEKYIATGSNGGLPIRVQIVNGGDGKLRDRTYTDTSDKSIYSVLSDLSGVEGGPEWTVGWEWQHSPERITPVLYVGDRIGNPVTEGLSANASFEIPGPVTEVSMDEDYSAGHGANDVMAVSTADGNERPQSDHIVTADPSRPTFEFRWTPSTSITSKDTLNSHASAGAVALANGQTSVSLSATSLAAPAVGVEWSLGDDIGYAIGSGAVVPAFPGGRDGVARAIGWELTLGGSPTVTPILAEPAPV